MLIAFIIFIVGFAVTIFSVGLLTDSFYTGKVLLSVLGIIAGLTLFIGGIAGMAKVDSDYNQETVRLCDKKDGVVSQDGHCFVDKKPVEFSPGVWER